MELTQELIRKHKAIILPLLEVRVRQQTRRSKKGKTFTVKAHERDIKKMASGEIKREVRAMERKMQMDQPVDMRRYDKLANELDRRDNVKDRYNQPGGVFTSKKEPASVSREVMRRGKEFLGMDISKFGKAKHISSMTSAEISKEERDKKDWYKKTFGKKKKRKSYDKNTGRLRGNPGSKYERPYGKKK